MLKRNENKVGESRGPAVAGGHQTAQQADIVKQEGGGKSDAERKAEWGGNAQAGRDAPAIGGSSNGHSDQLASSGPQENRKVAGGLYETEQSGGKGPSEGKNGYRPPEVLDED